jgi:hypothetical protein
MTTVGDLLAISDVLDALAEESDSLSLEDSIVLTETLNQLQSVLRRTQSMVDTQRITLLEQPTIVGGRRYVPAVKYTERWEHWRIARMITDRVRVDRETGEIRGTDEAVAQALRYFVRIYLSESTKAKKGELKKLLGIGDAEAENLCKEVANGRTVNVYDLEPDR